MIEFECPNLNSTHSFLEFDDFPFPLLALWGNKKWAPSMNTEKLENFGEKSGLTGCKWSSLNVPGTRKPLSHSVLELGEFLFPIIGSLG